MKLNRIMIAAPKSGSGKTVVTCALLQALKSRGQMAVAYKCGPDYIDPMFHRTIIKVPSKNLDTFFTGEIQTKELLLKDRKETDFAVIEGVMGLFDGLGGIGEEGSSYHLAKITKTPIVLVVDAKGMGRSLLPLLSGFLSYDTERLIRGVILNRMSEGYYHILKPLIEQEFNICVLGYFPIQENAELKSRHLGLVLPDEQEHIRERLAQLAETLEATVNIEKLLKIGRHAEALKEMSHGKIRRRKNDKEDKPVIAVARDEAFCFYYEDNLRLLEKYGATIEYFSPLHDMLLPKTCDGLLLLGGYPELYAKALSENEGMKRAIKEAFHQKMPVVAECGGFMYLHTAITDKSGIQYEMADVLRGVCSYKKKLVRFGYIELQENKPLFLPEGERIKGHEFHYFDSTDNGEDCVASKPMAKKSYSCVVEGETYWLGFPHLYYPSNPAFAKKFVEKARKYKQTRERME